jgi:hypothetical protein
MSKMSRELLDAMHRFALEQQQERVATRYDDRAAVSARRAAAGARA